MSDFYYTCVRTLRGLAYLAKQQAGMEPKITRAVAGEGYSDPLALSQLTDVLEPIGEMEIGEPEILDKRSVRLPLRVTSEAITDTALIRQVGVYAEDDEGEFLDTILQYDSPQPLPSTQANRGAIAIAEFEIVLTFENSERANIPTSPGWFLTRADLNAYNDQFIDDLSAVMVKYSNTSMDGVADVKAALDLLSSNKVNVGEPEMHPVQLGDGIIDSSGEFPSFYYKTDNNRVYISIKCRKSDNSAFAVGEVIATMPSGFRPKYASRIQASTDSSPSGSRSIAQIIYTDDGRIRVYNTTQDQSMSNCFAVYVECSYLAAL